MQHLHFYYWIIPLCIVIGILMGVFFISYSENRLMHNYDLYNCIYNNAQDNSFNQKPLMIKRIQEECICFREHNYTNMFGVNC